MSTKVAAIALGVLLTASPLFASADTSLPSNIEASLIAALTQLIQVLQQELQQLLALRVTTPTLSSNVTFSASPTSGSSPLLVTFSLKNNLADSTLKWFDFGDGTKKQPVALTCPPDKLCQTTSPTIKHTYSDPGSYIATLDDSSGNSLGTATITVGATTDSANLSATPTTGAAPLTVTFTSNNLASGTYALLFDDPTEFGDVVRYFNAPITATHTYTKAGISHVTLRKCSSATSTTGGCPDNTLVGTVTITVADTIR